MPQEKYELPVPNTATLAKYGSREAYEAAKVDEFFASEKLLIITKETPYGAVCYWRSPVGFESVGPFCSVLAAKAHAVLGEDHPLAHRPGRPPTPNLQRQSEQAAVRDHLMAFLHKLDKRGLTLCEYRERTDTFRPTGLGSALLVADFLGIDPAGCDAEAQSLLAVLYALNDEAAE